MRLAILLILLLAAPGCFPTYHLEEIWVEGRGRAFIHEKIKNWPYNDHHTRWDVALREDGTIVKEWPAYRTSGTYVLDEPRHEIRLKLQVDYKDQGSPPEDWKFNGRHRYRPGRPPWAELPPPP
jgi:hypothetical protein